MGADYYNRPDSAADRCSQMLEQYASRHGIDLSPRPELLRVAKAAKVARESSQRKEDADPAVRRMAIGCPILDAVATIRANLVQARMGPPFVVVAAPIRNKTTWYAVVVGTSLSGNHMTRQLSTYQADEAAAREVVRLLAAQLCG